MKTSIWYSVQYQHDGSYYPQLFESEELAELEQKYMEGLGESCTGTFDIEHESTITVLDVKSAAQWKRELEDSGEVESELYYELVAYMDSKD